MSRWAWPALRWRLGRLTVSSDYSFYFLITAGLLFDSSGFFLLGLLAALCHESAHLAVMAAMGLGPAELRLSLFGGKILRREQREAGYGVEMAVSLAGGVCNLLLAALFYHGGGKAELFSAINLVLGSFNLLPVQGLDGGRVLNSLICMAANQIRADCICRRVSAVVLALLWLGAVWLTAERLANLSLLLLAAYLTLVFIRR